MKETQKIGLEQEFTNRIAELDGVKPENVTLGFIRRQKEERYSNVRYGVKALNSVYDKAGLIVFTRKESEAIGVLVDHKIDRILAEAKS